MSKDHHQHHFCACVRVCEYARLVYITTKPFRGISMPLHCIHGMHNDAIGNNNVNSKGQKLSHILVYV